LLADLYRTVYGTSASVSSDLKALYKSAITIIILIIYIFLLLLLLLLLLLFTYVPSAVGRGQDKESSPERDRRSTAVLRHKQCRNSIAFVTRLHTVVCRTLYFTDWGETPSINVVAVNSSAAARRFVVVDDIVWPNGLGLDAHGKLVSQQFYCVFETISRRPTQSI